MTAEVVPYQPQSVQSTREMSVNQILARRARIIDVMRSAMKDGVHFGTIPGTPKPTLYKPGAEMLLSMFQLGSRQGIVDDLSTQDEIRYRVAVEIFEPGSGAVLGVGIGECSSNEAKYKWRAPVCNEEFDETPQDRRRAVWKKKRDGDAYQLKQIRTEPADIANTILKMAKKRGLVDGTLVVTAASDVFTQDAENIPAEWGILHEETGTVAHEIEHPMPQAKQPQPAQSNEPLPPGLRVDSVRVAKKGKNERGEWKLYVVKLTNGVEYSTFSETLAKKANDLREARAAITFEFEETDKGGKNLVLIEEVK